MHLGIYVVLRDGHFVGEYPIADLPRVKLVAAMMGKDLDDANRILRHALELRHPFLFHYESYGITALTASPTSSA